MRFLHRNCTPRAELHAEMRRYKAAAERGDYWERQYRVRDADATAAAQRHEVAVSKERQLHSRTKEHFHKRTEHLTEVRDRVTKERDEARYWLAAAESQLVDLRGAGVLTSDDIVRAIDEWDDGSGFLVDEDHAALIDALLQAQRKATRDPVEALDAAIEAATEGVTQEVGE